MFRLDPSLALPLYAQLAERLLKQIRAGEFEQGARIPSENTLSDRYGIGRPTVRQATETLIRRGYLERRRGSGTFVKERTQNVGLFSLGGTLQSFSRQGIELRTRLVEAPYLVTVEEKGNPLFGRKAYRLLRLGLVDSAPIVLEKFWFDAENFPFFDSLQVAGRSLSEAVLDQYQMEATAANQRFSLHALERQEAKLLDKKPGDSVLLVERELHFATAKSAVFVQMKCNGDRYTFSQSIGANGNPPRETT